MSSVLAAVAVGGAGLVLYSYVVYPVLLLGISKAIQVLGALGLVRTRVVRRVIGNDAPPTLRVAILISAFNEERHIIARIRNLLELDYPPELITVYIGSDGSTDATPALLRTIDHPRIRAFHLAQNRGKASMLNELVSRSCEPILLFSDANTFFRSDAVRRLVAHFDLPSVGGVSGELRLLAGRGDNQDARFWRAEQSLKVMESQIGGLLGANGAIYAIRRELWQPLEPDTICDDFVVGMRVAAARRTLVYESSAIAEEETPNTIGEEVDRRVRIGIGNLQSLFRNPSFLTSTRPAVKFAYVSHKVLRWIAPHLALAAFLAAAILGVLEGGAWLYAALLVGAAGLVCAGCYAAFGRRGGTPALLRAPVFLFALNWALLLASWQYATGDYTGSWRRSAR